MNIQIKRIYEAVSPADGKRILVDRLWPRGVSKERADLEEQTVDEVLAILSAEFEEEEGEPQE